MLRNGTRKLNHANKFYKHTVQESEIKYDTLNNYSSLYWGISEKRKKPLIKKRLKKKGSKA